MKTAHDIENPSTNTLQHHIHAVSLKAFDVNEERAEEELKLMKPSFMATDKYNRKLGFWTPLRDLQPFGPGVYFLFYTIRYFLVVFLVLAMMSMVPLIIYTRGGGLSHSPGVPRWLKTTIANSEGVEMDNHELQFAIGLSKDMNQLREVQNIKNQQIDLDLQVTLVWNCSFVILFILAIYAFKYLVLMERLNVDSKCMSISKFTLRLTNLPNDYFKKTDIKEFIRKFYSGKIVDINFAYKFNDTLHEIAESAQMKAEVKYLSVKANRSEADEAKIEMYNKKMEENKQIIQKRLNIPNFKISEIDEKLEKLEAYVIFNESDAPQKILQSAENSPGDLVFMGTKIQMSIPDDIRDINFINLEKSTRNKFYKLAIAVALCLVIIFGFLMLTLTVEHKFESLLPYYDCKGDNWIPLDAIFNGGLAKNRTPQQVFCLCKQFYNTNADQAIKDFCRDNNKKVNKFYYLSIIIIVLIEVVNLILTLVIEKVMKITQFASKTNKFTVSLIIFFSMIYLNTVLSVVISSDLIFGASHPMENGNDQIVSKVKHKLIRTFNPEWFEIFGYKMILLIFVLVFFPHVFMLGYAAIHRRINDNKAKKAKTHDEYMHLKAPFKFALAEYYVMILNLIFCTMTFAAGMPLLMILAFLAFAIMYPTIKGIFVTYSRKPNFLKPLAVQLIIKLLPLSVIIHLVIAIVLYGNHFNQIKIAENGSEFSFNPFEYIEVSNSTIWFDKCLPLTIILIVFFVANILEFIVYKIIKNPIKSFFFQSKSKSMIYDDKLEALKYWSGLNYDFRLLPKFAALLIESSQKQVKAINVMQSIMPPEYYQEDDDESNNDNYEFLKTAVNVEDIQLVLPDNIKNKLLKKLETIKEHASFAEDYNESKNFADQIDNENKKPISAQSTLARLETTCAEIDPNDPVFKMNPANSTRFN